MTVNAASRRPVAPQPAAGTKKRAALRAAPPPFTPLWIGLSCGLRPTGAQQEPNCSATAPQFGSCWAPYAATQLREPNPKRGKGGGQPTTHQKPLTGLVRAAERYGRRGPTALKTSGPGKRNPIFRPPFVMVLAPGDEVHQWRKTAKIASPHTPKTPSPLSFHRIRGVPVTRQAAARLLRCATALRVTGATPLLLEAHQRAPQGRLRHNRRAVMPDHINGYLVHASFYVPGGLGVRPGRIILAFNPSGTHKWVTAWQGGTPVTGWDSAWSAGHYYNDHEEADVDFFHRCKRGY